MHVEFVIIAGWFWVGMHEFRGEESRASGSAGVQDVAVGMYLPVWNRVGRQ